MDEFRECPRCAKKTGSPLLCPSCVHNRDVITRLAQDYWRARKEAFTGNVQAARALNLDAMDVQPVLSAVQLGQISTGRARELVRAWALGTFTNDMLPPVPDDGFGEDEDPYEAVKEARRRIASLESELAAARLELKKGEE